MKLRQPQPQRGKATTISLERLGTIHPCRLGRREQHVLARSTAANEQDRPCQFKPAPVTSAGCGSSQGRPSSDASITRVFVVHDILVGGIPQAPVPAMHLSP